MNISSCLIFISITLLCSSQFTNPGCARYDPLTNACAQCIDRHYKVSWICLPINPLCNNYNQNNGKCLSCFNGYRLGQNGQCLSMPKIGNCQVYSPIDWQCQKCKKGFYVQDFKCYEVSKLCDGVNEQTGECLSCINHHELVQGKCRIIPLDNCISQFMDSCLKCASDYFLERDRKKCSKKDQLCTYYSGNSCISCKDDYLPIGSKCFIKVNHCSEYNSMGKCVKCLSEYDFVNGNLCVLKYLEDNLCSKFSQGKCVECSFGSYKSKSGKCELVSSLCNGYDKTSGACTNCYNGYKLDKGQCFISQEQQKSELPQKKIQPPLTPPEQGNPQGKDPNCVIYNANQLNCQKCCAHSMLISGKCHQMDPHCRKFSPKSQKCLSCNLGFILSNGICRYFNEVSFELVKLGVGCQSYSENEKCERCFQGYYLGSNKQCNLANPLCKTINDKGMCTSCFQRYFLVAGQCFSTQ